MSRENYSSCPKAISEGLTKKKIGNELLIYDHRQNRAILLNEASYLVWEQCDGETSVETITELLAKKDPSPIDPSIVVLALEKLDSEELLERNWASPPRSQGFTRRELMTIVGKTSLVALPTVMAISIAGPASAQSCAVPGGNPPGFLIENCIGPVGACATVCSNRAANPGDATGGCCSGMGSSTGGGANCNPCPCRCL